MKTPLNLQEFRCDCGKLLFKGELTTCKIEVKCRKCHKLMLVSGEKGEVLREFSETR